VNRRDVIAADASDDRRRKNRKAPADELTVRKSPDVV
jgi:hypothetical protein